MAAVKASDLTQGSKNLRDIITDLRFPDMKDLASMLYFRPEEGQIWLGDKRMLLLHAEAVGALRQELIDSLGIEFTRGLLTRAGYLSGMRDAELAMKARRDESQLDMLAAGAQLHALSGMVQVEPVRIEADQERGYLYGEFLWKHSIEGDMHMSSSGSANEPVCWMEIGYSSGFLTRLMGKRIIVREVECVAAGDNVCRAVARPVEDWDDIEDDLKHFQPQSADHRQVTPVYTKPKQAVSPKPTPFGLKAESESKTPLDRPIGGSAAYHSSLHKILRVAPTNATVLLLGESGVGKTMFSHEIHANSRQVNGPFVEVNCAAIPDQLIESELFGVHRGAYSGASESRPGRFEAADGGTMFLDEIATLSMTAQSKLLRVLQSGELERLGSNKTVKVNVRLVAATNEDLRQAVKDGRFRSDLYYRINVFPVTIAPLRDRKDDLPVLLESILTKLCNLHGRSLSGTTPKALQKILDHDWPGNIREFENVIERGVIMADDNEPLDERHLSGLGDLEDNRPQGTVSWDIGPGIGIKLPTNQEGPSPEGEQPEQPMEARLSNVAGPILAEGGFSLARAEVIFVEKALEMTGGNISKAATLLGLTRAQLDYRLKKLSADK
ncbi:sigma 54-interacting transcriptional regulator [Marinobacter sp.]|uniref:sigma 54-interacting transcriptional regulator n=1 Tax=Marinobacter sp. TaxID=50741 RepID=UPI0034A36C57